MIFDLPLCVFSLLFTPLLSAQQFSTTLTICARKDSNTGLALSWYGNYTAYNININCPDCGAIDIAYIYADSAAYGQLFSVNMIGDLPTNAQFAQFIQGPSDYITFYWGGHWLAGNCHNFYATVTLGCACENIDINGHYPLCSGCSVSSTDPCICSDGYICTFASNC